LWFCGYSQVGPPAGGCQVSLQLADIEFEKAVRPRLNAWAHDPTGNFRLTTLGQGIVPMENVLAAGLQPVPLAATAMRVRAKKLAAAKAGLLL